MLKTIKLFLALTVLFFVCPSPAASASDLAQANLIRYSRVWTDQGYSYVSFALNYAELRAVIGKYSGFEADLVLSKDSLPFGTMTFSDRFGEGRESKSIGTFYNCGHRDDLNGPITISISAVRGLSSVPRIPLVVVKTKSLPFVDVNFQTRISVSTKKHHPPFVTLVSYSDPVLGIFSVTAPVRFPANSVNQTVDVLGDWSNQTLSVVTLLALESKCVGKASTSP